MDTGETLLQGARGRKEIELLRDQISRDRILLAGQTATLMFLDQPSGHPHPRKIWTEGIPYYASSGPDGVPPYWSEPLGKWCGRWRCHTEDGEDFACYDTYFSSYEQARDRFWQSATACGELFLPEEDIPTFEFVRELFEFSRSQRLLKWEVNQQPNHPETRGRIAWLHDAYEAMVRFLNAQLKSQEQAAEAATDHRSKTQLSEGNQTADWPPDEQWHFREGEAAFRGVAFPIQGVPWRLLKKLTAKSDTPVGKAALLDAIAADGNTGEEALRSHLSRTRDILRKAFQMSSGIEPLPNVERGANAAWKLDEKVFPSVAEIQRSLNGR